VHRTLGILRHFQAFSTPEQNPALEDLSTPAHPQVTHTVETVEKVPFKKLIIEKWDGYIEKHIVFGVPHNIFGGFQACCGRYLRIFSIKGFFDSLVGQSLAKVKLAVIRKHKK
jgi:hypothetical protein